MRHLRVCALYPTLLNIYADRGNLMVLRDRCDWRGISYSCSGAGLGDPLDPDGFDIYYLGGGQDRDQMLCAEELVATKRAALAAAANRGALIIGVCGGFQLLGHSYRTGGHRVPGLGFLDFETESDPSDRLVGNAAIAVALDGSGAPDVTTTSDTRVIAGFENHGGRTHLGDTPPLGRVLRGHGNNGSDGSEGARDGPCGNIIGTYLHGPLLAKNAWLADWLIATALEVDPAALEPLGDTFEDATHLAARRAAGL